MFKALLSIPFLLLFTIAAFAQSDTSIDLEKCKPDDAKCIRDLGFLFESGNFKHEIDLNKAAILYRQSADMGDSGAMLMLGILYSQGRGVDKNPDEALKWWIKSAEAGSTNAARRLGNIYANTSPLDAKFYGVQQVKQDYVEALKWYRLAIAKEQGNDHPSTSMAEIYEQGLGVKQDYAEAAKWYARSVDNPNTNAAYRLGLLNLKGLGVPQNYAEAAKLFHRAADWAGDSHKARIELARLYAQGKGVKQDYAEAWFHFTLGTIKGDKSNDALKAEIFPHLSAEEITIVEQRVKKWRDDYMASIFDHPH